ncbi:hypothetical protein CEE44_00765 [Candidatus Woesearchaeota archaeon B3_Woes]|nr:MAG: hypothetical protein CEE44_00765 [Candidatus Woesearchaeota archaeon B3_Woes]
MSENVLKPNATKVFFLNFLKVISIAIVLGGLFLILKYTIGFEMFLIPFEAFDVEVSIPSGLVYYFFGGTLGLALLLGGSNYLSFRGVRYNVYNDNITIMKGFVSSPMVIPFQNIQRITPNKNGIFKSILNFGSVVFELSGLKEKEIKLNYVDKPNEIASYLQKLINKSAQLKQAKFSETYRLDKITDRF